MPRIKILSELKSVMRSNELLSSAIDEFILDMQNLKQFYIKTEPFDDSTFIDHSKIIFSRWTIQEIFLFLAMFGQENNLKDFINDNGLQPEHVLEEIFCYPDIL